MWNSNDKMRTQKLRPLASAIQNFNQIRIQDQISRSNTQFQGLLLNYAEVMFMQDLVCQNQIKLPRFVKMGFKIQVQLQISSQQNHHSQLSNLSLTALKHNTKDKDSFYPRKLEFSFLEMENG